MRAGVLVAIGGAAAVLVATVPASAFYSGGDPETYYGTVVTSVEAHRGWQGNEGVAFEPVGYFTQRLPDDEFDDILLNLVNAYREQNGRSPVRQFEGLRVQSAIWSNKLADQRNADMMDPWYAEDAVVACNPLQDVYTDSTWSAGNPQDVFNAWMADPAARNGLLLPGAETAGIATVAEESDYYTTIRIAGGRCPGDGLPFRSEPTGLPKPTLIVDAKGSQLTLQVIRQGNAQLRVEVQRLENGLWFKQADLYVLPDGDPVEVSPPAGTYRFVVPAQSGYDFAACDPLTVSESSTR